MGLGAMMPEEGHFICHRVNSKILVENMTTAMPRQRSVGEERRKVSVTVIKKIERATGPVQKIARRASKVGHEFDSMGFLVGRWRCSRHAFGGME